MRYDKGHKDATHRQILETAALRLLRDGIDGTGIAPLMADAGLTHGGFYSHFASKDALVREAVAHTLTQRRGKLRRSAERADDPIEGLIRYYLRPIHRDMPDKGCAIAALSSEIARQSETTRAVFTEELFGSIGVVADALPGGDAEMRRSTATAIMALLAGTLQLARVVPDPEQSDAILENGIEAALKLARGTSGGGKVSTDK
ncbi:TetR/AcrR family transcriptional regulator [Labrys portucalensis]|uniref:TetR/AcrR family transcriptional regulator n=1 Tax=Labrys neptuniae TaxID=376174 RepID=A0ABV6ZCZ4_9HYPH